MKRYNLNQRREAQQLRRDAVMHLRGRGASWKGIGYALGFTGGRARELWFSESRRVQRRERGAAKLREIGITSADVRRITSQP